MSLRKVENLPELLSALETTGVTMLIGATWCGPCKRFMPTFEKAEEVLTEKGIPADFRYVYLDDTAGVDEATLANLLGVMSVPQVFHFLSNDTVTVQSRTIIPFVKEIEELNGEGYTREAD